MGIESSGCVVGLPGGEVIRRLAFVDQSQDHAVDSGELNTYDI